MDFGDWWLRHLLWNCPDMNITGLHWWSVNIGSGNGLVPSGNKPLPEPMLNCWPRSLSPYGVTRPEWVNSSPPGQSGSHFAYNIFRCIFVNEKFYILMSSSPMKETNARPLANASVFWAGRVENWPGQLEFYIEHIRDICFRASAPKI